MFCFYSYYFQYKLLQFSLDMDKNDDLRKPLNDSIKNSIDPSNQLNDSIQKSRDYKSSVHTEAEISQLHVKRQHHKLKHKYLVWLIIGAIGAVISLIIAFALPPLINHTIVQIASEKVVWNQDTAFLWAHFPGETHTDIVRSYSFFNFTNPQRVIFSNEKPNFVEVAGFNITQCQDYIDRVYKQQGQRVQVTSWLHFDERQTRNYNQTVKVLNVGGLGFWYQLKYARPAMLLQQGLATIFTNLQDALINTIFAQGIKSQFVTQFNITNAAVFKPAGISLQNAMFLWKDSAYGMQNQDNLRYWVNATLTSIFNDKIAFSTDALYLKDYFTLNDYQLLVILKQLNQYILSIKDLILENHYCQNLTSCTGRNLAIHQMASSHVTYNTPPVSTLEPTDTICESNVTCSHTYPELASFYKKVYLHNHPDMTGIVFEADLVERWFNYNKSSPENKAWWNTDEDCLLHIGNLDYLWQAGSAYDHTKNIQELKKIMNRFKLPSEKHTMVFWEWIKYFYTTVIKQRHSNENVGTGKLFTQGLYDTFSYTQDNLHLFLLTELIDSRTNHLSCQEIIIQGFNTQDAGLAKRICEQYSTLNHKQLVKKFILTCKNSYQQQWNMMLQKGAKDLQLQSFCSAEVNDTFGFYYQWSRRYLDQYYNCSETQTNYCSDYEIAVKQWANSSITRNPIYPLQDDYKPSNTLADWFDDIKPFEYEYFRQYFSEEQYPPISTKQAYSYLNFDNWMSQTIAQRLFGNSETEEHITQYIRYAAIFVGMGGLTVQKTAYELMFGYQDQLITKIKQMPPPFGGDPSIQSTVAFNDLNISEQQAVTRYQIQTGKNDYTQVGQFKLINGYEYLTINQSSFDGNQTRYDFVSPWVGHDYFYGTNGKFFSVDQFNNPNISIYVSNVQRYGSGDSRQSYDYSRFGFDLRIIYLQDELYQNSEQNPENQKYYQTFYAMLNLTSLNGVPIFATKRYFLNCTANWTQLIDLFDEKGNKLQPGPDNLYVIYQPYSGISFESTVQLQSNYYYQPDELFKFDKSAMLPVFVVYRSGRMAQQTAQDNLGLLKIAIPLMNWFLYIGIVIFVGFLALVGHSIYKRRELDKQQTETINQKPQEKKPNPSMVSLKTIKQQGGQEQSIKQQQHIQQQQPERKIMIKQKAEEPQQ